MGITRKHHEAAFGPTTVQFPNNSVPLTPPWFSEWWDGLLWWAMNTRQLSEDTWTEWEVS